MRVLCRAFVALVCICGTTCSFSSLFSDEGKAQPQAQTAAPAADQKPKLSKEELFSKENIRKLSESLGHFIYKSLESPFLTMDADSVVKGLQDAKNGTAAPMTEQEYETLLQRMQEFAFEESSKTNLQEAEKFLSENKNKKGVQSLENGKLQFEILEPGKSEETVKDTDTVQIHYDGKYLNGKTFSSSHEIGQPISISLSQTIPGFKKGMLGMKIGEKRRLYIHPDLGYGTSGQLLPNALLIFDVEAIKIEPPVKEEAKSDMDEDDKDSSDQVGLNDDDKDVSEDEGLEDDLVDTDSANLGDQNIPAPLPTSPK